MRTESRCAPSSFASGRAARLALRSHSAMSTAAIAWVASGVLGGLGVYHYLEGNLDVLVLVEEQARMAAIPSIQCVLRVCIYKFRVLHYSATIESRRGSPTRCLPGQR